MYANILDAPMSIVYSKEELNEAIEKYAEYDLVFVDTAGFSHKNEEQKEDIRNLIQGVSPEYTSEVYLVLSATTKYRDLLDIVDTYRTISEFKLILQNWMRHQRMEICSILSCIQMRNCLIRQMDRMYQMILNYSIHKRS